MERNVTLDFVRGVAILGILLLNISAFGLPKAAYLNPAWYGAITPQDLRYCLVRACKCCCPVADAGSSRG